MNLHDKLAAIDVAPDIRDAHTLPGYVYTDPDIFDAARERVFARSWQLVPEADLLPGGPAGGPDGAAPFVLLDGVLDEPLVLTRSGGRVRCLSNVCTHRANLVATEPGPCRALRCRYHGRRFGLDGALRSMPGFEGARAFPTPRDDLARVAHATWGPFHFVCLDGDRAVCSFDELIRPVAEHAPPGSLDQLVLDPDSTRHYQVAASWALYCDNYLEGLHIPYVHPTLARTLDLDRYATRVFAWSSAQIGVGRAGEPAFALPAGHPDAGRDIAGYYFWLFPNTMLNLYPWGISVNHVRPLSVDRTVVSFYAWVRDPALRERGPGAGLDAVEREDEAVVERAHRGARSRFYAGGRYAPDHEQCVHHFHRLLARCLRAA